MELKKLCPFLFKLTTPWYAEYDICPCMTEMTWYGSIFKSTSNDNNNNLTLKKKWCCILLGTSMTNISNIGQYNTKLTRSINKHEYTATRSRMISMYKKRECYLLCFWIFSLRTIYWPLFFFFGKYIKLEHFCYIIFGLINLHYFT